MTETVQAAARRLLSAKLALGYVAKGLHAYTDASGAPIYWRARLEHPKGDAAPEGRKIIRPLHLNGNGYALGEPQFPGGCKPIYNLARITADATAAVYVVEGEKAADALTKLGAVATTSGSADSAGAADWSALAGRRCILWPDNDDPGRAYCAKVATILQSLGCTLEAVDIDALALPPKGDAADWLADPTDAALSDLDALPRVPVQAPAPNAPGADPGGVELLCAADVKPEAVRWLWDGWLAAGKLHIFAGPAGTGKTTLAVALAATVTIGGRWPDGSRAAVADAVIWSGEDGIADTLVPRLHVNGANVERVRFVRSIADQGGRRPFVPAKDMPALAQALARMPRPPALLVIDPIVSAVAGDSHKNSETRRDLQPLVELGERIGCAILGISHFSKGTSGRDPVERVTGSIAFGALARVVLAAVKTTTAEGEPGPRLFARAKSNLGPDGGGFHYALDQCELTDEPGIYASRVLWGDAVEGEARALLAAAEVETDADERARDDDAKTWLVATLADAGGTLTLREVMSAAKRAGFPERTIFRARTKAGIHAKTAGFGPTRRSEWTLPGCDPATPIAANSPIAANTANPETLAAMAVMAAVGSNGTHDDR